MSIEYTDTHDVEAFIVFLHKWRWHIV